MSNTFGSVIKLSLFGESHGEGIGFVLWGIEPGTDIDLEELSGEMKRRAPGGALSTSRKEGDKVEILSGVLDGKAEGSPICGIIRNTNTRSADYEALKVWMRPSHADYPAHIKYEGYNDVRGGGHFSGRLTAPLVAAGTLCGQALRRHVPFTAGSHILKLNTYEEAHWDIPEEEELKKCHDLAVPCKDPDKVQDIILKARSEGDSVGGIVETAVTGLPAGLGEPFFDSLESQLAHMLFSIPAVKGVLFGCGTDFACLKGSQANDPYTFREGKVTAKTNHNGGVLGGITMGMPLVLRTVIKPTASIGQEQESVNLAEGTSERRTITGRHDPCIVLRAIPVIEAACKIVLYDAYQEGKWTHA